MHPYYSEDDTSTSKFRGRIISTNYYLEFKNPKNSEDSEAQIITLYLKIQEKSEISEAQIITLHLTIRKIGKIHKLLRCI